MILVTGFGTFPGVSRNPTSRMARVLDGARVAGHSVIAEVLPVSYARGPERAIALARKNHAALVLGMGVASKATAARVERIGVRPSGRASLDVDGRPGPSLTPGPDQVRATLDVARLAEALGCATSDDAGRYVCNAWLYQVTRALPEAAVGFLHVPPGGMEPERVLAGLHTLLLAPPR